MKSEAKQKCQVDILEISTSLSPTKCEKCGNTRRNAGTSVKGQDGTLCKLAVNVITEVVVTSVAVLLR